MISKIDDDGSQPFVENLVPVVARSGPWRVTLSWDGDGIWGRFSHEPEDDDRQMLRFHAERDGKPVGQGVTYLRATDPRDDLQRAASLAVARLVANAKAKKPDPNIISKLGYLHIGRRGPAIDVPVDSREDD